MLKYKGIVNLNPYFIYIICIHYQSNNHIKFYKMLSKLLNNMYFIINQIILFYEQVINYTSYHFEFRRGALTTLFFFFFSFVLVIFFLNE